jgi:hypothetical protein
MKNHVEVNSGSIKKYIENKLMWLMFHFIIQTNQKKPHVNQMLFLVFIFPLQTNSNNNNEI